MPTVFLSYAREDLEEAGRIAQQLTAAGMTVWRDQEQLHVGQTWPKALGEAIAASDALLLLWSSRAAASSFGELEWCTAVALRRMVLPCLLDQTPLPPSLAAIEAVPAAGIAAAARKFLATPAGETKSPDPSRTQRVVHHLAEIGGGAPEEVLQKAKAVFAQRNWVVQSPVWLIAVILAVGLGLALRIYLPAPTKQEAPASQGPVTTAQPLAGFIQDEAGEPLANVNVTVAMGDKVVASATTDSLGHYRFQVDGLAEADVTLLAQRDGFQTEKRYTKLGNPGFNFKMGRKKR